MCTIELTDTQLSQHGTISIVIRSSLRTHKVVSDNDNIIHANSDTTNNKQCDVRNNIQANASDMVANNLPCMEEHKQFDLCDNGILYFSD